MTSSERSTAVRDGTPHVARLLVIEHRPDEIKPLLETLRNERFDITVAFDGIQGYGRAAAQLPDLILLDLRMRQIDGFATCRLLKADPATAAIPVIFLTAPGSLEEKLTGLREGAVDYILKPFDPREVLARIRVHLKLANQVRVAPVQAPLPRNEPSDQYLVRAAVIHVSANLARLPGVAEIARRVGTHSKRLTRAFREHKGLTVSEFVRQQRLQLARRLLSQTPLSVADIAADSGFSSAANFATAFKADAGMSPSAFRQMAAKQSSASSSEHDAQDSAPMPFEGMTGAVDRSDISESSLRSFGNTARH